MQQTRSDSTYTTPVHRGETTAAPASFEEAYLRFAPLLRKIAVAKFGIPLVDAEPLVHDVFATYFTTTDTIIDVRGYLVGGICNAARHHLRRTDAKDALFCGEYPCAASPTESILLSVERKLLLRGVLSRIGERCRTILHRYYLNGETTESIACALHFKPATVLVFLSKCRKRAQVAYRSLTEPRS
jgi:RNA polymerase sigma factor (sigma-70 family)